MMDRRNILIICNPHAGQAGRRLVDEIVAVLEGLGANVKIVRPGSAEDSTEIARDAAHNVPVRYDLIVAAGGDGTINKIAAGLYDGEVPLGIIPAGSANVLVRDLGLLPGDFQNAELIARALIAGPLKSIRFCEAKNSSGAHPFLAMASAGFDARATANVSLALKSRIGRAAYALSGLRELLRGKPAHLTVKWPGGALQANWIIATKTRYFAGPFRLDDAIDVCDPDMTLIAMNYTGPLSLMKYLLALWRGRLAAMKDIAVIHTDQMEISADGDEPMQLDGDRCGRLPLKLRVRKKPLPIVFFAP